MEHFEYPVSLKRAKEGGYVVTCRDLPALATQGNDKNDALVQAADAMDEVFATLMKQGKPFPVPSKPRRSEYVVCPPAETVAKAALYSALREAKVTKVELARQLGVDEKEVRRLLDPHYQSKLPRIAQAVAVLGRRLVISLDHA